MRRFGWKPAVAVGLLVAVVLAATRLPLEEPTVALVEWVQGAGAAGVVAYGAAYVLATVLALPGSILTLGAGFAWGPVLGLLVVSPVSTLAATVAFGLGRTVARDAVARRMARDPSFAAVDRAVGRAGFRVVLLLRLSPLIPFNVLNYALGLTAVRTRDYVLASWLGMLPGTLLYVYLGSVVTSASRIAVEGAPAGPLRLVAYGIGLIATVAAVTVLTRLGRQALRAELAAAEAGSERGPTVGERSGAPVGASAASPAGPALVDGDPHDALLVARTHPADWSPPEPADRYDMVVLGGGTAGLVTAAGAAGLGARVALVERHHLGGDCLVTGCVPSKALLRAARAAADLRRAGAYGIGGGPPEVDFAAVMARVRAVRSEIAAHDAAERFAQLGVDVFFGEGRFVGPDAVEVDGRILRFVRATVATGARPSRPPIEGLDRLDVLTSDTVFALTERPARLVVIGGGAVGCELAQAFARLGVEVTLVELAPRLLPGEDPDASSVVAEALAADGVAVHTGARVVRAEPVDGGQAVVLEGGEVLVGDRLLVAAGRSPNVEGLGLEAAGVAWGPEGVAVDERLRTTSRRIYAAGDVVAGQLRFTHAADAAARTVLRNALFFGRRRFPDLVVPRVVYTDPEVGAVGVTRPGESLTTVTEPLDDLDRAIVDGDTAGFARLHVDRRGRIRGATVVGPHAGELIAQVAMAMRAGLTLPRLADTIVPYPTHAEVLRRAADRWNRTRLTPAVRSWLRRYFAWTR